MSEYTGDIEFNEIERQKKVRKKKNYLVRTLVVFACLAAVALFLSSGFFDIQNIEVEGNKYYTDGEVINIADATLGVNLFWGAGDSQIKANLEKNPYFSDIKVKRRLPSTLVIELKERAQIAAIVYGDKYVVIDKEGTVLRKSDVDPKLTLLTGLTISRLNVGEAVGAEETSTLETTLKMLSTMKEGDIYFKKIDVSRVVIKAYIYDTLIVKGTPKQMMKAIDSGNLQKVVNNLFNNDTTRGTINLGDHNYMSFSPGF